MARNRRDGGLVEFVALKQPNQRRVLLELANNGGRIFRACNSIGISPFNHFVWKREDPVYLKAFNIADDMGTEKLIEAVKDEVLEEHKKGEPRPNMLAAMFSIKGKRFEYKDNYNPLVMGIPEGKVTINVINYTVTNNNVTSSQQPTIETESVKIEKW